VSPVRKSSARTESLFRASRDEGFTILELLLVVALVAVFSGMVLGIGRYVRNKGRATRAVTELASLAAALESYHLTYGDYPRTDQAGGLLQALVGRRGPTGDSIAGRPTIEVARFSLGPDGDPFLNETTELLDPWGEPYGYAYKSELPWSNPGYVLYSAGPDGSFSAALLTGGFPDYLGSGNADNLWANPP
jgi:prepilin-type N-terminal cleavage/methylation domain-containing protein